MLRRKAQVAEGDALEVRLQADGSIVLRPIAVVDRLHADLLDRLLSDGRSDEPPRVRPTKNQLEEKVADDLSLRSVFRRLREGEISRRAFVARATSMGVSVSAIADMLASDELGNEVEVAELLETSEDPSPDEERIELVRVEQAYHSLLYLPLYIARDIGFFQEEEVEIEVSSAGGGREAWSTVEVGLAHYSIHDPVFAAQAYERGRTDSVVAGTICNGFAILAIAQDRSLDPTEDPLEFMKLRLSGRTVATQPEPDSQWAALNYLGFIYGVRMGDDYRNLQVPIGTEAEPVFAGRADIGMAFPPAADIAMSKGLHEVFDVSKFFGPFALSALCTTRSFIQKNPRTHHSVLSALEKACQYAYAFPEEAVKVAQTEFENHDPEVIARATKRCLERGFLPEHIYVDGEAWRESQIVHKFVGTLGATHDLAEIVDNEAALRAYRRFGKARFRWSTPRPIGVSVNSVEAAPEGVTR